MRSVPCCSPVISEGKWFHRDVTFTMIWVDQLAEYDCNFVFLRKNLNPSKTSRTKVGPVPVEHWPPVTRLCDSQYSNGQNWHKLPCKVGE